MEFCGNYTNRPCVCFEENDGEDLVETAGYISAKQQIEEMLYAGQRLMDYRREMYDYGPEDEDDGVSMDPTRRPGFDMADASMMMQSMEEEVKAERRRRRRSEEHAEEAAKEVQKDNDGGTFVDKGSMALDAKKGSEAASEGR